MEDLIKKIKEMQPTKEQLEGRTPEYAFGYVDALNEAVKLVNVTLGGVSKCECGETKDLITVCENCTYKMVSEGN